MRWTAIVLAGCVIPSAGCRLAHMAAHNLTNEPIEYLDERKVTRNLRHEARDILRDRERNGGGPVSEDFEDGFVDGYADFLEYGGNTAPPAVPPLKYRRGKYLNPEGHARIHDYFCGFQAGADTAANSGKRQFLTVPVLLPDPVPTPPVQARQIPAEQCGPTLGGACPPTVSRPNELLPPPRPQDPITGLPVPNRPLLPTVPGVSVVVPNVDVPAVDPVPLSTPVMEPPPPDVPAPKLATPVFAPPPTTTRTSGALDWAPKGEADFPRAVVPPLHDLPRKPGRSSAER